MELYICSFACLLVGIVSSSKRFPSTLSLPLYALLCLAFVNSIYLTGEDILRYSAWLVRNTDGSLSCYFGGFECLVGWIAYAGHIIFSPFNLDELFILRWIVIFTILVAPLLVSLCISRSFKSYYFASLLICLGFRPFLLGFVNILQQGIAMFLLAIFCLVFVDLCLCCSRSQPRSDIFRVPFSIQSPGQIFRIFALFILSFAIILSHTSAMLALLFVPAILLLVILFDVRPYVIRIRSFFLRLAIPSRTSFYVITGLLLGIPSSVLFLRPSLALSSRPDATALLYLLFNIVFVLVLLGVFPAFLPGTPLRSAFSFSASFLFLFLFCIVASQIALVPFGVSSERFGFYSYPVMIAILALCRYCGSRGSFFGVSSVPLFYSLIVLDLAAFPIYSSFRNIVPS